MSLRHSDHKLIISVVQRDDADRVVEALRAAGQASIVLSSTGGFLRRGNATILTTSTSEDVENVLQVIRANASQRTELRDPGISLQLTEWYLPQSVQVNTGGASVWVLGAELAGFLPIVPPGHGERQSGAGED